MQPESAYARRKVEPLIVEELERRVAPCVPLGLQEPNPALLAHMPVEALAKAGPPCGY